MDLNKLKKQKQIVEIWKKNDARGTVLAVTGFGKTYIAVLVIKEMNSKHPERTTCVVVPTINLKEQWESIILREKLKNVTVFVINTAITRRFHANLLVLDEIHRYASPNFRKIFTNITYNFILGLTATIERQDGNHYLLTNKAPVIVKIGLLEALKNKWISEYFVYNLGITLPDNAKTEYNVITDRFYRLFATFGHSFDKAYLCLNSVDERKNLAEEMGISEKEIHIRAINFFRYMQKRKQFLNQHPIKAIYAIKIAKKLTSVKGIIFSETIDFAETIANNLDNCLAFHSKLGKRKAKMVLDKFKQSNSGINFLSAAKALDEGFDVPSVSASIICSGNSTKRQSLQRMGRSIRAEKDKISLIVNLYIANTQDEKWVKSRTKDLQGNVEWITSIEEINYEDIGRKIDFFNPQTTLELSD